MPTRTSGRSLNLDIAPFKLPILTAVSWGLGGMFGFASPTLAETTGEIRLSGVVAPTVTLTPALTSEANQLDLSSELTLVQIANLEVETNTSAGYSLVATPGNLTNAAGQTLDYEVSTAAEQPASVEPNEVSHSEQPLYLQYEPTAQPEPGTYTGTITLSILDNE